MIAKHFVFEMKSNLSGVNGSAKKVERKGGRKKKKKKSPLGSNKMILLACIPSNH